MSDLKLGIIGESSGNGHPFSWSAICNGYSYEFMKTCPYPAIPKYLFTKTWPESAIKHVTVSHIWTQNLISSKYIAACANIPNVVENIEDMFGNVDGILLARDDFENHYENSKNILSNGIPLFIDKPIATNLIDLDSIMSLQKYDNQVFTCSSLRFSDELKISKKDQLKYRDVKYIEASTPNSWEKYSIHLIEPIIANFKSRGKLKNMNIIFKNSSITKVLVNWSGLNAVITSYGNKCNVPISINYFGKEVSTQKILVDPFYAFKKSIEAFIEMIRYKNNIIPFSDTVETVSIIECGTK